MWFRLLLSALLIDGALGAASAGSKSSNGKGDASERRALSPHIEELSPEAFVEKVVTVANGTGEPSYVPFVMFHMPWCEHCKRTIPELEETAKQVANMTEQGRLKHHKMIRFFMFSCASKGAEAICKRHTGKSYPSLIVFRDRRAIKFNRPRTANVITWWIFRVTRPAVVAISSRAAIDSTAKQDVAFLLSVRSKSGADAPLMRTWESLALDYIEQYQFFSTEFHTPLGKSLGSSPSVHVQGPPALGLKPLQFDVPLDQGSLKSWVNFNQFAPVVTLSPWTIRDLQRSGLAVVTLVHAGAAADAKTCNEFEEKALELRKRGKYLFSKLNSTDEDNEYLLSQQFPLLAPNVQQLPRIFVFAGGRLRYWEDPGFVGVDGLSVEAIERLLADPTALHDGYIASWIKTRLKLAFRLASRSWTSLFTVLSIPVVVCCCLFFCCRSLWQALFGEEDAGPSHVHID